MSFAILMADAFGGPTTDGIDDVGWAFNGTEAVTQAVPEGVDDTSIRHRGFSHLFSAALAELALHLASPQYFGKARVVSAF